MVAPINTIFLLSTPNKKSVWINFGKKVFNESAFVTAIAKTGIDPIPITSNNIENILANKNKFNLNSSLLLKSIFIFLLSISIF